MLWRTSLKMGTPWAVSLAIHLTLVGLLALLALGVALEPAASPQRYIDFDNAGSEPIIEQPPSRGGSASAEADNVPQVHQSEAMPEPMLPPSPSHSAVPVVPDGEGGGSIDAWLAPAPVSKGAGGEPGEQNDAGDLGPRALGKAGEVRFAGLGSSNARSVVYVVDASGPMVSTLREVIEEVDRSVSRLSATQRFGVIAFGEVEGERETLSFMPVLVRATPQAKGELREWLTKLTPAGKSNPLSGLRGALKQKPDAVFLLSRGIERSEGGVWELGLERTLAELERLNPVIRRSGRRGVVVKTIQFLHEDPTGTMQRIGQVHGASVGPNGEAQPGYRVVRQGSELSGEAPVEMGR